MKKYLRIGLITLLALCWSAVAIAQSAPEVDFNQWAVLAAEAEEALDNEDTAGKRFNELRGQLAEFRANFDAVKVQNASRIATLREQLAALGPVAEEEGAAPEAPDVAATRADLNGQLSILLVPVQRAEAAFVRADALISQIDQALRGQQTQELIRASPSPLNPAHWPRALSDISGAVISLMNQTPDTDGAFANIGPNQQLAVTILLGILALALILRGQHWSLVIAAKLRNFGGHGLGIWRFLASLLRVILPFGGLFLLAVAADSSQFFGPDIEEMFYFLPFLGGFVLGVRWVSERVFARDEDEALVVLAVTCRREIRFQVASITALIVAGELVTFALEKSDPAVASKPALMFPIMVLMAVSLFRIGGILRNNSVVSEDDDSPATFKRVVHSFGTAAILVAVVATLLAALGFFRAADALMPPFIITLALLGLVMALQRFAADVYGTVTGQGVQARETLLPVLLGLVLLILSAPLVALIWGTRVTDLTELWQAFLRGFAIGESRISPTDFLAFAVIFAIGYLLTRLLQSTLRNNVLPKTQIDVGGQNAMVAGLGYVGIFLAALAAITGAGLDLSSLAIVAGALSVGIGFGLQNIVSNFVSGIILLIERPISEGDWIEVGGQMGYVRDISVRSTRIETFDRTDVIVPNADLVSGTVTNYTRGNTVGRVIVTVGVAYGTDTKKVEGILREIAEDQPMVLNTPPPSVLFLNFGADSLEFEVRCYLRDVNWKMVVRSDINHQIAARFAEEGIEIPFAQRDVWLRNPEVLQPSSERAAPKAPREPDAKEGEA